MSILDNKNFALLVGPWGDDNPSLFYIKKRNTETKRTEVHILSAASNHKNYSLHVGTGLHETHENFVFKLADWNGDGIPDLWAIKKWGTDSGKTEVHIYSGASNFETPIFHGATAQNETGFAVEFDVISRGENLPPDLVMIQRSGTESGRTELHIMSGANDFQTFILHTKTGLHETGTSSDWSFIMTDWNNNGVQDFVAVSPANGGELHSLIGPDYRDFNMHARVSEQNIQENMSVSNAQNEVIVSCTLAASRIATFWLTPPITWPLFAVSFFIPTYIAGVKCYADIKLLRRLSNQPSGTGSAGNSNIDPFQHPDDRPDPIRGPGSVTPPPIPPGNDDPGHLPVPFEPEEPEEPFQPEPPPGEPRSGSDIDWGVS